ncbi:mycofactocin biosynthesis glycosyltransferase MftF [Fodinicola feengrottensis]|uniref:mycofactocin biosynthesis glycosyltransferase MftF n=1 Tax=Fodinicola feengrottensis TaxID=435914 RepID=UPI0024411639|nr:mycofactocin biosynthesis glycosyltransferase MftF [Fodinicola feengrottensis]
MSRPGVGAAPEAVRLPKGFAIQLDPGVRVQPGGRVLIGGMPLRILTLSRTAAGILADGAFVVSDDLSARLADRLLATGVAHPRPAPAEPERITVVVPVKDRPAGVDRLLTQVRATVTPAPELVVVDDGSRDQLAIARIARTHGARLVRHRTSKGPSAARNAGFLSAETRLVAFLDSDCAPLAGWLEPLLAHFADPLVAAAARASCRWAASRGWTATSGSLVRWIAARPRRRSVFPRSRVPYVPSAALVVRRDAFGAGFDETMRVAEDVDLVWRLVESGWRVRYEPAAQVAHEHRTQPVEWLRTRAYYGTGAAPLALRHGSAVAPLVMDRWSAGAWALALTGDWRAMVAALGVTAVAASKFAVRLREDVPALEDAGSTAYSLVRGGTLASGWQVASLLTRHAWPVTLAAALVSRRARRIALAVAVGEGVAAWIRDRPPLDPVRYVLARRLDDLAYGTGLWVGAARHRTFAPLRPDFTKVTRPPRR